MDDRNVALSEQVVINAPETTDYDENTMFDVEVMSEKPASLSETWHFTSSIQHHHPQLLHSVFVHRLWIIISWRVFYSLPLHKRGLLYFHPLSLFVGTC